MKNVKKKLNKRLATQKVYIKKLTNNLIEN